MLLDRVRREEKRGKALKGVVEDRGMSWVGLLEWGVMHAFEGRGSFLGGMPGSCIGCVDGSCRAIVLK